MGTISSSVGLISGMDIQSIVEQLMKIESQPLYQVQQRVEDTTAEQEAYNEISSHLIELKSSVSMLSQMSTFRQKQALSTDEKVLTATASNAAAMDSYSFCVHSLVTSHQLVSNGFLNRDRTPVGAGDLTFKVGDGFVDRKTSLATLNGFQGVRRGIIQITDQSGASAEIDLRTANTVDDVLSEINSKSSINVRAKTSGDRIIIEDLTGQSGSLIVEDIEGGFAAVDLGIVGTSTDGTIEGNDLVSLTETTPLSQLNDGIGLSFKAYDHDFKVTLSDGTEFNINLSDVMRFSQDEVTDPPEEATPAISSTHLEELNDGRGMRTGDNGELKIRITNHKGDTGVVDLCDAETIDDVKDILANATADDGETPLNVQISAINQSKLTITDSSEGEVSNLIIENVEGAGYAATDLGIATDTEKTTFNGSSIYRFDSVGSVMRAIQYAEDSQGNLNEGRLQISIAEDGNGLVLEDMTGGTGTPQIEVLNDSKALRDLGLDTGFQGDTVNSRDLIAGLNTVLLSSLNGGKGVETGPMTFHLQNGEEINIDFTDDQTLQDVIDKINEDGHMQAQVSTGGLGLAIEDLTEGNDTFHVLDQGGEPPQMAVDLGLSSNNADRLTSTDLHLQFISENTSLQDLNSGKGVDYGQFTISDSTGKIASLTLTENIHQTVGDVIDYINNLSIDVTARINENGDGIELIDEAGGEGGVIVNDINYGSAAADLAIAGQAEDGNLVGSFSKSIDIDEDDTLDEVVTKINDANVGVHASIINDGSGYAPYRLLITSDQTGSAGRIAFNTGSAEISFETLSKAQDATITMGDPNSGNMVVVNSSSNTIKDVIDGVTLELHGTSSDPVNLTISQDPEKIVSEVESFVESFNAAVSKINEYTEYDSETGERGVLLGDSTISMVYNQLFQTITHTIGKKYGFDMNRMSDVGLSLSGTGASSGEGNQLIFDSDKMLAAMSDDPEAVADLFAKLKIIENEDGEKSLDRVGIMTRFKETLENITTVAGGTITRKQQALTDKIDNFNERIKDLEEMLERKEERLYAQFQSMESALAEMQSQQSALSSLSSLVSSLGGGMSML